MFSNNNKLILNQRQSNPTGTIHFAQFFSCSICYTCIRSFWPLVLYLFELAKFKLIKSAWRFLVVVHICEKHSDFFVGGIDHFALCFVSVFIEKRHCRHIHTQSIYLSVPPFVIMFVRGKGNKALGFSIYFIVRLDKY